MDGPLPLARGPFSFIRTLSGLFCSLARSVRPILSASGSFSIACVARVDSILSNVRTFFVRTDLLYVMGGPLSLARGPFLFIRTPSGLFCSLKLGELTIFYHARFARERLSSFFTCARGSFATRARTRGTLLAPTRASRADLSIFFPQGGRPSSASPTVRPSCSTSSQTQRPRNYNIMRAMRCVPNRRQAMA